ncbi:hypothetical protein K470DRAFT_258034 [Piedraia hortae CBS 480.64]|uniref:Uncharacterized protein n=1 Tax=Piedraia hortae CBS 480.64 TaxID=1314780 RepID=A0A6A7BZ67_9PEZI|nr:hypothetical protein K470DRAFT_258034 [Piedraia hortae CBS 480.64]
MPKRLDLASNYHNVDLKHTEEEAYEGIALWLRNCNALQDISISEIKSAPDIVLPVLLNKDVKLRSITIKAGRGVGYRVKDHHDFHKALTNHRETLTSLVPWTDPDPLSAYELNIIINIFISPKSLKRLICDLFSNEDISLIGKHTTNLEYFYVGGYGIPDHVLNAFEQTPHLRKLLIAAVSNFTKTGLLEIVDKLSQKGQQHWGFHLIAGLTDPGSTLMSADDVKLMKRYIVDKLGGSFGVSR